MIVTGRDFRANQSRYIGYAHNGEDVILKSRAGSVRLIPVDTGETKTITFDKRESRLLEDAHNMAAADIERIRQKDEMTIEESQMLLLRMVEEEYQWHMANTDKWYYAYTIDGDTITIQDACHAQNMHE